MEIRRRKRQRQLQRSLLLKTPKKGSEEYEL